MRLKIYLTSTIDTKDEIIAAVNKSMHEGTSLTLETLPGCTGILSTFYSVFDGVSQTSAIVGFTDSVSTKEAKRRMVQRKGPKQFEHKLFHNGEPMKIPRLEPEYTKHRNSMLWEAANEWNETEEGAYVDRKKRAVRNKDRELLQRQCKSTLQMMDPGVRA